MLLGEQSQQLEMGKSLLSCSCNTRELGGICVSDGKMTRYCVFWRSDVPVEPSQADVEKLIRCGMTNVVDLRTEQELRRTPNRLSEFPAFRYFHLPISEGSGIPDSLEAVPLSYMEIAQAKNMPDVLRIIAEADNGVLFHCSAGKDRTGVVAAIILMACGASKQAIISDYVISRENYREKLEAFLSANPQIDSEIVLANEKSMNGFIDLFTQHFETVEKYFDSVGLSAKHVEMIRKKLLMF